ncbi:hypothetical protein LCGC14_2981380, partial [marine sediment metagenome]
MGLVMNSLLGSRHGGGDEFFGDVVLLLPMVGASATSLSDKSSRGHNTWTFNGTSKTVGAQFKFVTPSLSIEIASPRDVFAPDSGDWDIGDGDFTVEAHVRFRTLPVATDATILAQWAFPNFGWNCRLAAATMDMQWSTTGGNSRGSGTQVYVGGDNVIDTWFHFTWTRQGTTYRLFRDGVQAGADVVNVDIFFTSADVLHMGASDVGSSN